MIRNGSKVVSPSRTYVVFTYTKWLDQQGNSQIEPRIVLAPEDRPNTGSSALAAYMREHDAFGVMESLILTKEEFDLARVALSVS